MLCLVQNCWENALVVWRKLSSTFYSKIMTFFEGKRKHAIAKRICEWRHIFPEGTLSCTSCTQANRAKQTGNKSSWHLRQLRNGCAQRQEGMVDYISTKRGGIKCPTQVAVLVINSFHRALWEANCWQDSCSSYTGQQTKSKTREREVSYHWSHLHLKMIGNCNHRRDLALISNLTWLYKTTAF